MPTMRNIRRGSSTDALASLRELGAEALVEELLQDRIEKSGLASSASLLVNLEHLHGHPPEYDDLRQ